MDLGHVCCEMDSVHIGLSYCLFVACFVWEVDQACDAARKNLSSGAASRACFPEEWRAAGQSAMCSLRHAAALSGTKVVRQGSCDLNRLCSWHTYTCNANCCTERTPSAPEEL